MWRISALRNEIIARGSGSSLSRMIKEICRQWKTDTEKRKTKTGFPFSQVPNKSGFKPIFKIEAQKGLVEHAPKTESRKLFMTLWTGTIHTWTYPVAKHNEVGSRRKKHKVAVQHGGACAPHELAALFWRGAGNRTWTCTVSHGNLNPACLPFPPYPHIKKPIANAIGFCGAAYEARTRYLHLGKVALYQMS